MPFSIASRHGARLDLLAAHEDLARDPRPVAVAEQAHRELGAPRAHEARDADDLAGAHVDRHVVDHDAGRVLRVVRGPVLDAQQLLADVRLVIGVAVLEIAADHVLDDAVLGDLGLRDRLDRLAVADDRHGIGDLLDLVQLVADDDRRDPLLLEAQDQIEQVVGVLVVEGGRRLVEDQQLHFLRERLRDLDELLLADADLIDRRRRVLFESDPLEQLRPPRSWSCSSR